MDRILAREATAFNREVEVERILKAFKLKYALYYILPTMHISDAREYSPYEILDVAEDATPEEIKKKYRQLSLCEYLVSFLTLPFHATQRATFQSFYEGRYAVFIPCFCFSD